MAEIENYEVAPPKTLLYWSQLLIIRVWSTMGSHPIQSYLALFLELLVFCSNWPEYRQVIVMPRCTCPVFDMLSWHPYCYAGRDNAKSILNSPHRDTFKFYSCSGGTDTQQSWDSEPYRHYSQDRLDCSYWLLGLSFCPCLSGSMRTWSFVRGNPYTVLSWINLSRYQCYICFLLKSLWTRSKACGTGSKII